MAFPVLKTIVYLKRARSDSASVLRGIPFFEDSADSANRNSADSADACDPDICSSTRVKSCSACK